MVIRGFFFPQNGKSLRQGLGFHLRKSLLYQGGVRNEVNSSRKLKSNQMDIAAIWPKYNIFFGHIIEHFNPELFNPKIKTQTFQNQTFQAQISTFQPWTNYLTMNTLWDWTVWGWSLRLKILWLKLDSGRFNFGLFNPRIHDWKVRDRNILQPWPISSTTYFRVGVFRIGV